MATWIFVAHNRNSVCFAYVLFVQPSFHAGLFICSDIWLTTENFLFQVSQHKHSRISFGKKMKLRSSILYILSFVLLTKPNVKRDVIANSVIKKSVGVKLQDRSENGWRHTTKLMEYWNVYWTFFYVLNLNSSIEIFWFF